MIQARSEKQHAGQLPGTGPRFAHQHSYGQGVVLPCGSRHAHPRIEADLSNPEPCESGRRSDQKARWTRYLNAGRWIRYPCVSAHLSALIRRHSSLYFWTQVPPIIVREVDRRSWSYRARRSAPRPRRRQFVFRLPQLHARNCSGLDQRLGLLPVGIQFLNSREDYSCRRAASGSIRDARLAGA